MIVSESIIVLFLTNNSISHYSEDSLYILSQSLIWEFIVLKCQTKLVPFPLRVEAKPPSHDVYIYVIVVRVMEAIESIITNKYVTRRLYSPRIYLDQFPQISIFQEEIVND